MDRILRIVGWLGIGLGCLWIAVQPGGRWAVFIDAPDAHASATILPSEEPGIIPWQTARETLWKRYVTVKKEYSSAAAVPRLSAVRYYTSDVSQMASLTLFWLLMLAATSRILRRRTLPRDLSVTAWAVFGLFVALIFVSTGDGMYMQYGHMGVMHSFFFHPPWRLLYALFGLASGGAMGWYRYQQMHRIAALDDSERDLAVAELRKKGDPRNALSLILIIGTLQFAFGFLLLIFMTPFNP